VFKQLGKKSKDRFQKQRQAGKKMKHYISEEKKGSKRTLLARIKRDHRGRGGSPHRRRALPSEGASGRELDKIGVKKKTGFACCPRMEAA